MPAAGSLRVGPRTIARAPQDLLKLHGFTDPDSRGGDQTYVGCLMVARDSTLSKPRKLWETLVCSIAP